MERFIYLWNLEMDIINTWLSVPASCYQYQDCVCGAGLSIAQNSQPVNIVTSFVFVVLAIFLYVKFNGKKNIFVSRFALLLVLEALSAAYLHWKMTLFSQILDYALVTMLIIYGEIYMKWKKKSDLPLIIITLLVISLEVLLPDFRFLIAGIPLVIYAYMNLVVRKNKNKFLPMLFIFLIGFAVWQLGERFLFCDETSIFQFHSVWHLLVVIVGYMNVKYYLSLK